MKNILFFISSLNKGGATKFSVDVARILRNKYGVNIKICFIGRGRGSNGVERILKSNGFEYIVLENKFFRRNGFVGNRMTVSGLRKFIRKNGFSKVYSNTVLMLDDLLEIFGGDRVILHLHLQSDKISDLSEEVVSMINNVKALFAVSDEQIERLKKIGVTKKIKKINGIDFSELERLKGDKIPVDMSFTNGCKVVCSCGYLSYRKGVDIFLKVASTLVEIRRDLRFVWIGGGEYGECDFPENSFFLGELDNPIPLFEKSDVFFIPSRDEGLSLALMENMALGKHIVAFDISEHKKLLGPETVFGIGDIKGIADYFAELDFQSEYFNCISERNLKTAFEKFSLTENLKGLLDELN